MLYTALKDNLDSEFEYKGGSKRKDLHFPFLVEIIHLLYSMVADKTQETELNLNELYETKAKSAYIIFNKRLLQEEKNLNSWGFESTNQQPAHQEAATVSKESDFDWDEEKKEVTTKIDSFEGFEFEEVPNSKPQPSKEKMDFEDAFLEFQSKQDSNPKPEINQFDESDFTF